MPYAYDGGTLRARSAKSSLSTFREPGEEAVYSWALGKHSVEQLQPRVLQRQSLQDGQTVSLR